MVRFDNTKFKEAVDADENGRDKLAYLAGSTPPTMKKLYNRETDVSIASMEKLADYFDLDVEIQFVPKRH